jgi:protein-S-isoprenylcysteine O-methyltransferase Ste14
MPVGSIQPSWNKEDPAIVRTGAWLFRQRTWLPVPIFVALLLFPPGNLLPLSLAITLGLTIILVAESLRLWAVHHIGAVSRTRSDRLGPLILGGPFAWVRNPLYIGNIAMWIGFACLARVFWLIPVILLWLGVQYHAIVRWEESLLTMRLGDRYREYSARVGRWWPRRPAQPLGYGSDLAPFSWNATLFSERGTLIAIGVGALLLWVKTRAA